MFFSLRPTQEIGPSNHFTDTLKALFQSTSYLTGFILMCIFGMSPWLIAFGALFGCVLVYSLTLESANARFMRINEEWLKQHNDSDEKNHSKIKYLAETFFMIACTAIGLGVTFGLGSYVGVMMFTYGMSHFIGHGANSRQRSLYLVHAHDNTLKTRPKVELKANLFFLGCLLVLIGLTLACPPSIIVTGGAFAAGMLMNVFILTAFMSYNIHVQLKTSLLIHSERHHRPPPSPPRRTRLIDLVDEPNLQQVKNENSLDAILENSLSSMFAKINGKDQTKTPITPIRDQAAKPMPPATPVAPTEQLTDPQSETKLSPNANADTKEQQQDDQQQELKKSVNIKRRSSF